MPSNSIFVPRSDWANVKSLLKCPTTVLEALESSLDGIPPERTVADLLSHATIPEGITVEEADDLLGFTMRIQIISWMQNEPFENFVRGISDYFEALSERQEWWDKEEWDKRRGVIQRLFTPNSSLWMMAKAEVLSQEYGAVLIRSSVIADTRFVFDKDGTKPIGGLVAHTLVLEYQDADYGRKRQFMLLDKRDINILIEQLQRAAIKQESIASSLNESGIQDMTRQ